MTEQVVSSSPGSSDTYNTIIIVSHVHRPMIDRVPSGFSLCIRLDAKIYSVNLGKAGAT